MAHWLDTYYGRMGAANPAARAATIPALYSQIMYLIPDLYAAGFPKDRTVTAYAIAQMMLESDWLTSNVANTDNNYSGILWINKPYQNASKGLPVPKTEGKGFYAHFGSLRDWARDFYRVLSLNTGGQGRPIDADTAQQYLDRLKANHYFTSPRYYTSFNSALKRVNEALTFGSAQDKDFLKKYNAGQTKFTVDAGKGLTSNATFDAGLKKQQVNQWLSAHKTQLTWIGVGIGAVIVIRAASK